MNGLFFLLCCAEILSALLCGASTNNSTQDEHNNSLSATPPAQRDLSTSVSKAASAAMSSARPATKVTSKTPATSPPPVTQSTNIFQRKDCLPLLMVSGGLMVVCTILLVSTLLLACKVCHLARRVKGLSSNSDLISNTEYWTGADKKGKSKSEAEPKETTVLMADISETPAETGNGTKEEGLKATEEGQMEEAGDGVDGEEASAKPVADADKSSPSKPQEEAADSQTTKAASAPTSEGTGEPKDVV